MEAISVSDGRDDAQDGLAIFGAMMLGAILGGIAALLLAPKPGDELREEIGKTATGAKEKAEDLKEQMTAKYQDLTSRVDEHLQEHREEAAEAAADLGEEVEEQIEPN